MPILSKRTPERFYDLQIDAFNKLGISTRNAEGDVAYAIASSIADVLSLVYDEFYSVTDNILPSDATGKYLERYGEMLGEDRSISTPAKDFSLNNVYLALPGNVLARDITIDGGSIQIESGFELMNSDGSIRARVVNSPIFGADSNKAYCQVVIITGQSRVAAGALTRASVSLSDIPNVDITKIQTGIPQAFQPNPIGEVVGAQLSDSQYKYVLLNAAEGLGQGSIGSIRKELTKIPTIAYFEVREHTHGNSSITIFVQSIDLEFDHEFLEAIKIRVQNVVAAGTRVHVEQPEIVDIGLAITLKSSSDNDLKQTLRRNIQDNINQLRPGTGVTINTINSWIEASGLRGVVTTIQRRKRDVPVQNITIRAFEKLAIRSASDIIIK